MMDSNNVKSGRVDKRSASTNLLSGRQLFWVDLSLLFIAFFIANYFKRGSFVITELYSFLLLLFFICWLPSSLVAKKFQTDEYKGYWPGIVTVFKANCYLAYLISFIIVFFNCSMYSRVQVFATCLLLFLLNVGVWSVVRLFVAGGSVPGDAGEKVLPDSSSLPRIKYWLLVADLALLFVSFFAVNFIKRGNFDLKPGYDQLLLIMVALWLFSALLTEKYVLSAARADSHIFWQWEKAGLMMLASVAVVVYAFRLFHYSRFQGFGTVVLLMALEAVMLFFVYGSREKEEEERDIESVAAVRRILDQEPVDLNVDIEAIRQNLMSPVRFRLEPRLKNFAPGVFEFIEKSVPDLDNILCLETDLEQNMEPLGRNAEEDTPVRLFVNLHKLNDMRRLNEYFLEVYQILLPGGYFIGYAHTIQTHYQWVYRKFPRLLAPFIYGLDFIFNRVFPKLPRINALYFMITKGKNRIISRAEVLGRLSFCGFEIVAEQEFDRRLWVIGRKVKKPSFNENPTYGPLVTLNRSGYRGEIIKVYKLRTMHPYSEYLQDYVFKMLGLQEGGKIKDDFRVTAWGRVLRKLWIDELPMLFNWLKGDLKIVGVRPLSSQYLSLYDEELQNLRKQTRPGLIPPFYVDMPVTFEEICASEKKYLRAFMKNPVRTDLYYGFWSLYNIFIKNARSK